MGRAFRFIIIFTIVTISLFSLLLNYSFNSFERHYSTQNANSLDIQKVSLNKKLLSLKDNSLSEQEFSESIINRKQISRKFKNDIRLNYLPFTGGDSMFPPRNDTEYKLWCKNFQELSIYNIGLKLSCTENKISFSLALMFAVFLSLLIETAIDRINNSLKNHVSVELFQKVLKEIAMLGIISYGVKLLESIKFIDHLFLAFEKKVLEESELHELTKRRVLIFELVHIILFLLSCFFVAVVFYCYKVAQIGWKRWEKVEKAGDSSLNSAYETINKFETNCLIKIDKKWKFIHFKFNSNWLFLHKWWQILWAEFVVVYWESRKRFISSFNLDPNFRYNVYLKDRSRRLIVQMAEVGYPVWLIILFYCFLSILFSIINFKLRGDGVFIFVIIFFLGTLLSCIVSLTIVRISYHRFLRYILKGKDKINNSNKEMSDSLLDGSMLETENNSPDVPYVQMSENMNNPIPKDNDLSSTNYNLIDAKNFFISRSPKSYIILMQATLFTQCFYFSILILHYACIILISDEVSIHLALKILFLIVSFLSSGFVFITFPLIISNFVIITSFGNLTSISSIATTKLHMKQYPDGKKHSKIHHSSHREYLDYKQSNFWKDLKKLFNEKTEDYP